MATNPQIKKKARSLSLTDDEIVAIDARAKHHKLERSAYVLALYEADKALSFAKTIGPNGDVVLRPVGLSMEEIDALLLAEDRRTTERAAPLAKKRRRPDSHSTTPTIL